MQACTTPVVSASSGLATSPPPPPLEPTAEVAEEEARPGPGRFVGERFDRELFEAAMIALIHVALRPLWPSGSGMPRLAASAFRSARNITLRRAVRAAVVSARWTPSLPPVPPVPLPLVLGNISSCPSPAASSFPLSSPALAMAAAEVGSLRKARWARRK